MRLPFLGGRKEAPVSASPTFEPVDLGQRPQEDPYASVVSYFAGGKQSLDEIRPVLEKQFGNASLAEQVLGRIDQVRSEREAIARDAK